MIKETKLFSIVVPGAEAASIDISEFERILNGDNHLFNTGWSILGDTFFSQRGLYAGVEEFYAYHKGFAPVFGRYETGVYSTSAESLKKFYEDHPPFPQASS